MALLNVAVIVLILAGFYLYSVATTLREKPNSGYIRAMLTLFWTAISVLLLVAILIPSDSNDAFAPTRYAIGIAVTAVIALVHLVFWRLLPKSATPQKLSLIPSKGFFVVSWAVLSALVVLVTPASPRQILWDHSHRLNDLTGIIEHSYLVSAPFLKYLKLGLYSGIIAQVLTSAGRYHTAALWCFTGLILIVAYESLSIFAFTHWGRTIPEGMATVFYMFNAVRLFLPIGFLYIWSKTTGKEEDVVA